MSGTALPPVSFFIPCFNCEAWLEGAVASILETNLRPGDEVVLVDDGATDATPQLVDALAQKHEAARAIHHVVNGGGAAARNTAVAHARHDLLFCLDSDNLLLPHSVTPLREAQADRDIDVISFGELRFFKDADPTHTVTHCKTYPNRDATLADYLGGAHVAGGGGNMLFTRAAFDAAGGYPEQAGALDAWGFGLRLAMAGRSIGVVPGSGYLHRYSHDSYWTRDRRDGEMAAVAADLLEPVLHRLTPRDQRYITSKRGRSQWFYQRDRRPLKLDKNASPSDVRNASGRFTRQLDRRRVTESPPMPLRLVLGIGRSGTSWAFRTLATSNTPMHAWLEPMHRMSPEPRMSRVGEFSSSPFITQLTDRHPLRLLMQAFASGFEPDAAAKAEVRHDAQAEAVLLKEVHALLAMPAFLADPRLDVEAVVMLRDPVTVADSVFDAQGLETRYLIGETRHCESPWFLEQLLTPGQFTQVRSTQRQLYATNAESRETRVLQFVLTAALIQRLLSQTAERLPHVIAVEYDELCGAPHRTFEAMARHLNLRWESASIAEVARTTTGRDLAASQNPYSIVRDTTAQLDRPMRFLSPEEARAAREMLEECGLASTCSISVSPSTTRLAG